MVFWGRRKREEQAKRDREDAELVRRAQQALVETDERIRTTRDELSFAQAELGEKATHDLSEALHAVATHMREAFALHQQNHDALGTEPGDVRARGERILQLCEWAEQVLDERTEVLRERIEKVREAPMQLQRIRTQSALMRERLPATEAAIARLSERYSPEAMQRVGANAVEARQLLDFADHSADVAARRRESGHRDDAMVALETATEAVRRAGKIIDGVDDFEIEAMRAQSTLADVVADSRGDIQEARLGPQTRDVAAAIAALENELRALPAPGTPTDPFADLARIGEVNAALDRAVSLARERAARPVPSLLHVQHDVDAADRAIAVTRSLVDGHRGWIGADARTRLAEAERTRIDVDPLMREEDTREHAQQLARRTAQLANEALRLAQRDIDSSRPDEWGGGWGGPPSRGGGGGGGLLGPMLGGAVIGSLLGGIFD
ncbi:hypothetical protein [Microbacterium amylolyticum]|uniref:Uncharacterized protein n=1 Tax=Microbacterium amylolyticum TaxID=936337 RepID=A0ABS4ZJZ1_9MICO|nr:hypothetical protein [Microbacterium amylolyticum]MBP2437601.1 hypothetical protein [Microbacterium amylolyticum]